MVVPNAPNIVVGSTLVRCPSKKKKSEITKIVRVKYNALQKFPNGFFLPLPRHDVVLSFYYLANSELKCLNLGTIGQILKFF